MGNSLRCCLACVLPCGALDLIRIVHLNGHVEEITRPVTAGEILKANPNHVVVQTISQRQISIISPESHLRRGGIYFLIPDKKNSAMHHNKSSRRNIPRVRIAAAPAQSCRSMAASSRHHLRSTN
ncbi:pentatricopeptide repeat-containing protein [Hibiscus syriacus]|uniref:Pentatricopeptide repeat-containing protein n=1 Tax=Hibiscus syriacus TaxID=106335 RepID=A0A6A3B2P1_HIBSY|nr:uncharacterized protein LOC120116656 [Hibiscus syriacus]KAE8711210.1 pentatricopeptide repeat-containing protein [Hibiscus syriacus]